MTKTKAVIHELRMQGFDSSSIMEALRDGKALEEMGLGDKEQESIEIAFSALKSLAAAQKSSKRPKRITSWSDNISVGIWNNEYWTLRLYADRAILRYPTVVWSGNSGSLYHEAARITGRVHEALLKIAHDEIADGSDYTERVRQLIWEEMI